MRNKRRWSSSERLDPEVDRADALVQQFAEMLRTRTGELLDAWLAEGWKAAPFPHSGPRIVGVQKDQDAVRNGLTWPINNDHVA